VKWVIFYEKLIRIKPHTLQVKISANLDQKFRRHCQFHVGQIKNHPVGFQKEFHWQAYSFSSLFIILSPLNHKRNTSSFATPIFCLAKNDNKKDRRFPLDGRTNVAKNEFGNIYLPLYYASLQWRTQKFLEGGGCLTKN